MWVARIPTAFLVLALATGFTCAGGNRGRPDDRPSSVRIIGQWTSEPYDTQLGETVQRFCFRPDGTLVVNARTQAGPMDNDVAYRVAGEKLTINTASTGSSAVLIMKWEGDDLILTGDNGKSIRFRRTAKSC